MSRTIRKRFASNKKQKSQFVSHTHIQSNEELENSWIFENSKYMSLNFNDFEQHKKIAKKLFHSDTRKYYNQWTKSHKQHNKNEYKSQRNRSKSLLKQYTSDNNDEFLLIEEVYITLK